MLVLHRPELSQRLLGRLLAVRAAIDDGGKTAVIRFAQSSHQHMRAIATSIVAAVAWSAGTVVPASAETINVYDDHGGSVAEYDTR